MTPSTFTHSTMPPSSRNSAVSPSLVLTSSAPLSKEQTAFNALIKKIDARRATLADWGKEIANFRQCYVSDLLPLQDEEIDQHIKLARSLDLAYGQKEVTKGDRHKLSAMIIQLAEWILERREDNEIKAFPPSSASHPTGPSARKTSCACCTQIGPSASAISARPRTTWKLPMIRSG